jgi:hypothetical protein
MDGSKRSAHANAYFTGFGAAKRVVFFDTLLAQLSPGEIDAVLAHELGHFKHRHILKRIVVLFALSGVGLAALTWHTCRLALLTTVWHPPWQPPPATTRTLGLPVLSTPGTCCIFSVKSIGELTGATEEDTSDSENACSGWQWFCVRFAFKPGKKYV